MLDLAKTDPAGCVDIAGVAHRHFECELVVRRVSGRVARVKGAAGKPSNIAASAKLAWQSAVHDAGGDGAVL